MMIVLVAALLVLFFPKQRIVHGIETEKSNYDLTLVYLKSIAHAYPDNPENWMRLLDAELTMGNTQSANNIFTRLKQFKNIDQTSLTYMGYKLLKTKYQHSAPLRKAQLRKLLKAKLREFIRGDDSTLWLIALQEARELQMPEIELAALERRISQSELINPAEVRTALQLAEVTHKTHKVLNLAEAALRKSADPKIYEILKNYSLARQAYGEAAKVSASWFRQSGDKAAFADAAKFYFWAKKPETARKFLRKYEVRFLNDPATAQHIIRLYLANNMPEEAHRYTLELLKHERILP
jgi:hypothetical protein